MLTDLATVLRKANLKVVEVPGWKTRGRPGLFKPKGVLCHHTAGPGDGYADAKWMATVGRSDLAAPLAQLALDREGTFYVLAAGRANHAGRCKAIGGLRAYPGQSYGDGNEQMIGIEAQNRGTDAEGWSKAQYQAYVAGVAALTKHYGWSIVFGHKETSLSGKTDPDFSMGEFRRDVAAARKAEPAPPAAPPKEQDMQLDDLVATRDPKNGDLVKVPYSTILSRQDWVYHETVRQKAVLDAIAKKLLTPAEVEAALKRALDETISDATVVLGVRPEVTQ